MKKIATKSPRHEFDTNKINIFICGFPITTFGNDILVYLVILQQVQDDSHSEPVQEWRVGIVYC